MTFMLEVGFEPTHPKITELESAALDHSAIQAPHTLLIPDGIRTRNLEIRSLTPYPLGHGDHKHTAATRDRTGDLQIFSLTLSQLSYSGAGDSEKDGESEFRSRCLYVANVPLFRLS